MLLRRPFPRIPHPLASGSRRTPLPGLAATPREVKAPPGARKARTDARSSWRLPRPSLRSGTFPLSRRVAPPRGELAGGRAALLRRHRPHMGCVSRRERGTIGSGMGGAHRSPTQLPRWGSEDRGGGCPVPCGKRMMNLSSNGAAFLSPNHNRPHLSQAVSWRRTWRKVREEPRRRC